MRLTHIDVPSLQPSFTAIPPTRLTPQPGYHEEFSKTNREVTRLSSRSWRNLAMNTRRERAKTNAKGE